MRPTLGWPTSRLGEVVRSASSPFRTRCGYWSRRASVRCSVETCHDRCTRIDATPASGDLRSRAAGRHLLEWRSFAASHANERTASAVAMAVAAHGMLNQGLHPASGDPDVSTLQTSCGYLRAALVIAESGRCTGSRPTLRRYSTSMLAESRFRPASTSSDASSRSSRTTSRASTLRSDAAISAPTGWSPVERALDERCCTAMRRSSSQRCAERSRTRHGRSVRIGSAERSSRASATSSRLSVRSTMGPFRRRREQDRPADSCVTPRRFEIQRGDLLVSRANTIRLRRRAASWSDRHRPRPDLSARSPCVLRSAAGLADPRLARAGACKRSARAARAGRYGYGLKATRCATSRSRRRSSIVVPGATRSRRKRRTSPNAVLADDDA